MSFQGRSPDVLLLTWRDLTHPQAGGSEHFVHRVAEGLAADGLAVWLFAAAHPGAPAEETRAGVRIVRRGGRLTVYVHALVEVRRRRPRVAVDVQNGVPFLSPLVRRGPVVVLVHHVHGEQWAILFGRFGRTLGWWLESRVAPHVYRRCRYVTVSESSADELVALGVQRERIAVVHNGTDPAPRTTATPDHRPRLVVLGRLVPHKRVEHALDAVAVLRRRHPALRLDVVGDGWWAGELHERAAQLDLGRAVRFHGRVDEATKHELLARAWVHLCPSVKEGWGLAVVEAATHRVPTVAYRMAGGLRESVRDDETGLLVDDVDDFIDAVGALLDDSGRRRRLGRAANRHVRRFDWASSRAAFREQLLRAQPTLSQRLPYSSTAPDVGPDGCGEKAATPPRTATTPSTAPRTTPSTSLLVEPTPITPPDNGFRPVPASRVRP